MLLKILLSWNSTQKNQVIVRKIEDVIESVCDYLTKFWHCNPTCDASLESLENA